MIKKLTQNPWLIFLPFLFYYAHLIIQNKWPSLYGDEIRYVFFARNLLHGYYSPYPAHINLWNGPGYPIILMPFIALKIPALYITLMNALYQYLSVIFLFKALRLVTNYKTALVSGLLLAVYPNALSMLPILYTEAFTGFLVSLLVYYATIFYATEKIRYMVLAGLVLGFIILTKIIFGSVLLVCLAVYLAAVLFSKNKRASLSSLYIFLIAFSVAVPYLTYTYYITGKVLYWGNSGGMSLYWMSTPYDNEYGDWKNPDLLNKQHPTLFKSPEAVALLNKNHSKEINFILHHNDIEQDALFKQRAIANIRNNPSKFFRNYCYNFSRMLFNFPYSYSYQDGAILENILIGSFTLWASLLAIIITCINWQKIISPVKLLLLITSVYLLISGALSAYPRQLNIIVPVLLFWAGFLVANIKTLSFKFAVSENLDDIELNELADIGVYTQDTLKDKSL